MLEPFVLFDIMRGHWRATWREFVDRTCSTRSPLETARLVDYGPLSIDRGMAKLCNLWCIDKPEGLAYRVEDRGGEVVFLAKYVRHDKIDGCYLPEVSGKPAVWNWRPEGVA